MVVVTISVELWRRLVDFITAHELRKNEGNAEMHNWRLELIDGAIEILGLNVEILVRQMKAALILETYLSDGLIDNGVIAVTFYIARRYWKNENRCRLKSIMRDQQT